MSAVDIAKVLDDLHTATAFVQCAYMAATPASSSLSRCEADALQTCCNAALASLSDVHDALEAAR